MFQLDIIDEETGEIWTTVEIDDDVEKSLTEACEKTGKTMQDFITDVFTEMVEWYKKNPKSFIKAMNKGRDKKSLEDSGVELSTDEDKIFHHPV